jgi:hypothetical protein
MARSIAADSTEAWRAVIVRKDSNGRIYYEYEGIYNTKGTAKGRVTYWRRYYPKSFYDGWVEKADITWNKVKD